MALAEVKKALDVFGQFEDAAVVGANALENAVAVKQAVVEHRNFGVLLVERICRQYKFSSLHWPAPYGWSGAEESNLFYTFSWDA